MTSSWRYFMLLGFENLKFCKTEYTGYHLSKFQISWLSGSNFMEVSVRPPKTPLSRHYHVISYHWISRLAYLSLWRHFLSLNFQISIFVEHDIGYQPFKFQCSRMSGSNFMEGPPLQCYNEIKMPSAYRVKFNPIQYGGHYAPTTNKFFLCCIKTACSRKMKIPYF